MTLSVWYKHRPQGLFQDNLGNRHQNDTKRRRSIKFFETIQSNLKVATKMFRFEVL